MNIYNNIKPLCRFSLSFSNVLPKIRFRNYSTVARKYNRCQNRPWRSSVFVSAHKGHNVFSFKCFSDRDSDLNHFSKDGPTGDSSTVGQGSSEAFSLDVLVALLKQENAQDVCVVKLPEDVKYAQYCIVVTGLSTRHLKAMALYAIKVYKYMKQNHEPHVKIQGKNAEDWMCIDFGNMVVHFMLPESRDMYELDKLWTFRSFDEQLRNMPEETLPEDFIFDLEVSK